jgi:soluble lytic murein transglycosylase
VPGFRTIVLFVCIYVLTAGIHAAPLLGQVPLPPHRPAIKGEKLGKAETRHGAQKLEHEGTPLSIAPATASAAREAPVAGAPADARLEPPLGQAPILAPPPSAGPSFAAAAATTTAPLDLSAAKQAIDLVRKNRQSEATDVERTISDPVARKLVEWVILRSEDGSSDFSRYAGFIAANPSWPGIEALRRRAEAVMWQDHIEPVAVIDFFRSEEPHTAKGHFAPTSPAPRRRCAKLGAATLFPAISRSRRGKLFPA